LAPWRSTITRVTSPPEGLVSVTIILDGVQTLPIVRDGAHDPDD
jgi:hypothetical protein